MQTWEATGTTGSGLSWITQVSATDLSLPLSACPVSPKPATVGGQGQVEAYAVAQGSNLLAYAVGGGMPHDTNLGLRRRLSRGRFAGFVAREVSYARV